MAIRGDSVGRKPRKLSVERPTKDMAQALSGNISPQIVARPGSATIHCHNRQCDVTMAFCLDNYTDVNALDIKDSQCFRCTQGSRVRVDFSDS